MGKNKKDLELYELEEVSDWVFAMNMLILFRKLRPMRMMCILLEYSISEGSKDTQLRRSKHKEVHFCHHIEGKSFIFISQNHDIAENLSSSVIEYNDLILWDVIFTKSWQMNYCFEGCDRLNDNKWSLWIDQFFL